MIGLTCAELEYEMTELCILIMDVEHIKDFWVLVLITPHIQVAEEDHC